LADEHEGDGEKTACPEDADENAARVDETARLAASGPGAGHRAGGLALLGVVVAILAVFHYHFANGGSDAFTSRLDAELLADAELTIASMERGSRLTVVPSWPIRLYRALRRDIAVYTALAALAALCWSWSARARARREAYLVHKQTELELAELRRRLDALEKAGEGSDAKKGT
jgi:hypothetical protein